MKWEYVTANFNGLPQEERNKTLNIMGNDKWELVCVGKNGLAYFKRPYFPKINSETMKALEGYFGGKVG